MRALTGGWIDGWTFGTCSAAVAAPQLASKFGRTVGHCARANSTVGNDGVLGYTGIYGKRPTTA